jgi:hypothetical protein
VTEPIKLPPLPKPPIHLSGWTNELCDWAVDYARLAVEQATAELRAELATAEYALRSKGYRKSCDISACNCGDQWSHGGNADARLRELSSELHRSPVDMNGKTLLAGLSELVERAEKAEAEVESLRADAADFHMAYRMKCDEETKAQAVEIERLRAELARRTTLDPAKEMLGWTPKDPK